MIGNKIPEAITRYIVALYWQSPLLHFESSAFVFFPNDKGPTEGSEISQKPVRNRPNATSLSLPCLFPHPLTRTPTPTPIPISTTTTATATVTASAAGTTVSFPDRFRTAQVYFAPKFEIECVHAWILTLITRLATTLSTTTTPAATAPPLPLVHLGISAFAFKSNWHESRWRVRNQSETRQKPAKRNHLFPSLPPSLSLSFSLSLPLPLFPCPATKTPTPIPTPTPTTTPTTTTTITTTITTATTSITTTTTTTTPPPTTTTPTPATTTPAATTTTPTPATTTTPAATTTTTPTPPTTTTPTITVNFPDRFRTAQFSFLKYENECVHGRILVVVLLLLSVLPLAPLPLQRRYHYYTEEFLPLLFFTWQKFHGRVRNQSETCQKPAKREYIHLWLTYD